MAPTALLWLLVASLASAARLPEVKGAPQGIHLEPHQVTLPPIEQSRNLQDKHDTFHHDGAKVEVGMNMSDERKGNMIRESGLISPEEPERKQDTFYTNENEHVKLDVNESGKHAQDVIGKSGLISVEGLEKDLEDNIYHRGTENVKLAAVNGGSEHEENTNSKSDLISIEGPMRDHQDQYTLHHYGFVHGKEGMNTDFENITNTVETNSENSRPNSAFVGDTDAGVLGDLSSSNIGGSGSDGDGGKGGDGSHLDKHPFHEINDSGYLYKEYFYYDHAGSKEDNTRLEQENNDITDFINFDDGGERNEEKLLYWFEVLKRQGRRCGGVGGGFQLCFQDDVDSDESEECADGENDDEDCDKSRRRFTAYLWRDENERDDERGRSAQRDNEGYLISVEDFDVGYNERDNESNDDDNDDDYDDVYLFVDGNATNLLSLLNISSEKNETSFQVPENNDKSGSKEDNVQIYFLEDENQLYSKYANQGKSKRESIPIGWNENVQRNDIELVSLIRELDCRETGICLDGTSSDRKVEEGHQSDPSKLQAFSDLEPGDMMEQDLYFISNDMNKENNISTDIAVTQTTATNNETNDVNALRIIVNNILNKIQDMILGGNVVPEPAMHTSNQEGSELFENNNMSSIFKTDVMNANEDSNFIISDHKETPLEETFDMIMRSDHFTEEEKNYIASLEELRRLVKRLGGFETVLKKPEVHRIVKRQTSGSEACVVLRRRRRRDAGEFGDERTRRTRRSFGNGGRNLEEGNPRFRHLFRQYKTLCDFVSMSVFER